MNDINYSCCPQELKCDIRVDCHDMHTISGMVVDCCKHCPIEGVTVKALSLCGKPIEHTVTDCHGKFTLVFECKKPFKLVFYKPCYETYYTEKICGCFVEVCLKKEERQKKVAEGYVRYCCGKGPVKMASVKLISHCGERCYEAFTDCSGKFVFTKVKDGIYKLHIDGNTVCSCEKTVIIEGDCPVVHLGQICVKYKSTKNTLNGVITDCHGCPLKDTAVAVYRKGCCDPVAVTTTNCKGEYFFGGLKKDEYCVKVYCR